MCACKRVFASLCNVHICFYRWFVIGSILITNSLLFFFVFVFDIQQPRNHICFFHSSKRSMCRRAKRFQRLNFHSHNCILFKSIQSISMNPSIWDHLEGNRKLVCVSACVYVCMRHTFSIVFKRLVYVPENVLYTADELESSDPNEWTEKLWHFFCSFSHYLLWPDQFRKENDIQIWM